MINKMKKLFAILLVGALIFSVGCGKNQGETATEKNPPLNETRGTGERTTVYNTESPDPAPMDINGNLNVSYGKRTGTKETYTGLEPLKPRDFPVIDPGNSRGISVKEINHSYGVSENGKPHEISVNNQKNYEIHNGFCLDTSGRRIIYLTFDCGYENGCTEKILDTLKEKNVKAAFFLTLPNVKDNPELIARMINEGHIVGNHSTNHPNFAHISRTEMVEEIQELDDYLRTKFGYSAPYFRFPEGACSESALDLVNSLGYRSVFWSSAYSDWDISNPKGADFAFDTVTSRLHPGCVLLLHAVSLDNADALDRIIDYAVENGYEFKAITEY